MEQLNAVSDSTEFHLRVFRGTRELEIRSKAHATGAGIRWLGRGRPAEVVSVAPGSAGAKWGLRSGDLILQAGAHRSPISSRVDDLLSRNSVSHLVVLRGDSELLLERPQ
jgi:hypothetical protein